MARGRPAGGGPFPVRGLLLFLLAGLLAPVLAWAAQVAVPPLDGPVVDLAGVLDAPTRQRLEARALELQQRKGSQLQVLVVPTTGEETIEAYARRVFDTWAIGRQGVDDGVLLLVATADRRVRIEPGYGLEGAIPDAVANRIIQEYLVPHFREGDYGGGIEAATGVLAGLVEGEPLPAPVSGHAPAAPPAATGLVVGAFLGLVAGLFLRGLLAWLPRLPRAGLSGIGAGAAALVLAGGGLPTLLAAAVVGAAIGLASGSPARYAGRGGWGGGGWGGGFGGWGGGMGGGGGFGGGWGGGGGRSGGGGASGSW